MRQSNLARVLHDQRALSIAYDHLTRPRRPAAPQLRGYHVEYNVGEPNRCPGCSATAWHVGRFSAECARCGAALPIARSPLS